MQRTPDDILRLAEQQKIEFIILQFTDILGMVKNVTIPIAQLPDCLDHGVWFDGSSIEGLSRNRIAENDMYLVPDLDTYASIPWDNEAAVPTARLICDVHAPDGRPFAGDPRTVLRRAIDEAAQMGLSYHVAPEMEFFLLKSDADGRPLPVPHDVAGYFDATTDGTTHVRRRMARALHAFGIEVEATHHEVAIGQHEIDLRYAPALRAADNIVTLRNTVKAIAHQHGLYATFMPKPLAGVDGSGMHVHQSLAEIQSGHSAFSDTHDAYGLSKIARHYIAGLLAHAPGMIAILAPLVNSYKRLVPGFEAPIYLSWGRTNRSALVRVPRIIPGRPQTTRIELRCADPSCNPYLAFAAMLHAGLDGIRRELQLPAAAEEDLFQVDPRTRRMEMLPSSLGQALVALQNDEVITHAIGPHVLERFVEAKTQEWDDYRTYVSRWELDRYLTIY
jgi:glutamine synthetase